MLTAANEDAWERWRLPVLTAAIFLIVVVPALLLQQMARNTENAANWVLHSQQVRQLSQVLESSVRDVESSALMRSHGVELPVLNERMSQGRAAAKKALSDLVYQTRDNPQQLVRLGQLESTIERRMQLAETIARARDPEKTQALIQEMVVSNPMRDLVEELQASENALLVQRGQESELRRVQYAALSWGALVVQLLLLGTVIWLLQRQTRHRLAAERASLSAAARASLVLQTVREPIVLLDAQQRLLLYNTAFAELYGLGDEDMRGSPLDSIGSGAWSDPTIRQRLADILLRGRELWDFEHEQHGADDVVRTMLLNARRMPLPDQDDQVVLMTVSDISLQKAANQRIQDLNRQLEGKVEQVSEVNRELEAFSYSVSHDLRAPLRHVAGFADKLARHLGEGADEKAQHYMQVISSSAQRMATLIDDLLVYSRLGRSAMRMQAVDMQSLVAETRAIVEANSQAEQPEHRIDWQIAPMPILVADENMMRQLWTNLIGNAIKYSNKRPVARINIGYEALPDGSHHFSVADNGAGFDMEYASKLFGVFQRLHKASEYPGTGIGLATVRRVLSRHGGRIWAESKVDQGATFHFILPPALDALPHESKT
ncbi:MAG TPA: ATP-binding protein [Stenotrophomonas sp.]|nr:ATP-binding protein [Stenotrophomonas sp.]